VKKAVLLLFTVLSFYSCGQEERPAVAIPKPKVIDPLKAIAGTWEAKVLSARLSKFNISLPVKITFNKDNTYKQSFTELGRAREVSGKYRVSQGIVLRLDIIQTAPRRAVFKGIYKILGKNLLKIALRNAFVGQRPLSFTDSNTEIYHRVGNAPDDIYVTPTVLPQRRN
jgi:hypothetical protein